jgi:hypothetical protein
LAVLVPEPLAVLILRRLRGWVLVRGVCQPSGLQPATLPSSACLRFAEQVGRTVVACACCCLGKRPLAVRASETQKVLAHLSASINIKRTLQPPMGCNCIGDFPPFLNCQHHFCCRGNAGKKPVRVGLSIFCAFCSVSDTDDEKQANM